MWVLLVHNAPVSQDQSFFGDLLKEELTHRVAVLAESASGELDLEDEELEVDGKDLMLNENQTVQWFDLKGNLVGQQGERPLTLPFDPEQVTQAQTSPYPVEGVVLPVHEEEKNDELIGYVRASESLEAFQATLQRLDWRLGSGVIMALILSGLGGIWLTHLAMQPIEKNFQKLQQFTAAASHELRNPLMAIKSNAAVALKYRDGIRNLDAEKFQAIASAATQMTALTEDLLLLARTDQALPQTQECVNLSNLLTDLVQLYRAEAELKHIELTTQLQQNLEVLGDAVQFTRLFTNLLHNALHYTPDHGSVQIEAQQEDRHILVRVSDTGVGIAPDQLEHIFDRFWRADRSRVYGSGFGLGLAIAQNIAQSYGGIISVTSQLGTGSSFTVRLQVSSTLVHLPPHLPSSEL